jgi:peptide/nickel transport system substrate-binding protein
MLMKKDKTQRLAGGGDEACFVPTMITIITMLIVVSMLIVGPVQAQDDDNGGGIVNVANFGGTNDVVGSLNPLYCDNSSCRQVTDWLFPYLLAIDPVTGTYTAGNPQNNGLAANWDISDDIKTYTFHLRDDAFWSDGTSITAYDVFYSYMAIVGEGTHSPYKWIKDEITAVVPLDERRIVFIFTKGGCDAASYVNIPMIPAHVFEPDFASNVAAYFDADGDLQTQFDAWTESLEKYRFRYLLNHPFNDLPTVTGGRFELQEIQLNDYVRLATPDRRLAINYIDVYDMQTATEMLLEGEISYIENPPLDWWSILRERDDIQTFTYPGTSWIAISLNMADPAYPESDFDEQTGEYQEQGYHPVFSDVRVRRALQMSIDIQTVIDAAYQGEALIMPSNVSQASWAYNDDLPAIEYDPVAASKLLHEAGWHQVGTNINRRCIGCLYAPEESSLQINLSHNGLYSTAEVIADQIEQVGFSVQTQSRSIDNQRYDASVIALDFGPEQTLLFGKSEDIINDGWNFGSYNNPQIEELFYEARYTPQCDLQVRAAYYHQVQALLQEDQPYIWLFAPYQMVAVRDNILNFEPYIHDPLWNIDQWRIWQ